MSSDRVVVCKASPVGDEPVDSVTIEISGDINDTAEVTYRGGPRVMAIDAELIVRALRHLPGGTWDRVLIKMLEAHVSVLRVQFPAFSSSNEVEKPEGPDHEAEARRIMAGGKDFATRVVQKLLTDLGACGCSECERAAAEIAGCPNRGEAEPCPDSSRDGRPDDEEL
jgi:hypothetical protein